MDIKELIEFCFKYEANIRRAIYEKRNDSCAPHTGGSAGHCRISDITANAAIKNAMPLASVIVEYGMFFNGKRETLTLRKPEGWLKVVEWTKQQYKEGLKGEILKARYVACESRKETVERLNISPQLYSVLLTDIMTFAKGVAVGLGLLPPKH